MAAPKSISAPRVFEPDDRQRQAIEHVSGPMLVVAGAGTGKTTVLTGRIARLIQEGLARPEEILAVTYTENAAQEMRQRVQRDLRDRDVSGLQVTTFHAYCNNLLIRSDKQFGVLDDKDLWIYLRRRIRELHLDYFVRAANVSQFLNDLLDFMRRCHDELVGPEKYARYVQRLERGELPIPRVGKSKEELADEEVLGRCREIANVFTTVERMLAEDNLGSFGHMITKAFALLQSDAELLKGERQHARFILIDEFQDANFAQVKVLEEIAGTERNVFAVGDPDQAIYRFRGASSAAFGLFHRHFPEAKLVILEKNRRSTTPILKTAFALIAKNPAVFAAAKGSALRYQREPLVSAREETAARERKPMPPVPVEAVILTAKDVESADVAGSILQKRKSLRAAWSDFAVLYRQHQHRDQIAEELTYREIPFSIENMDVMDTPAVRDLLACIGVTVSGDGANLFRLAALPQFGVNPEELRTAMRSLPRNADSGIASVLHRIGGGQEVLRTLQLARDEIARAEAKGRAAVEIVARRFALDQAAQPIRTVLDFITAWERKPITKKGTVEELWEYLEYFREAGGTVSMPPREGDAVRLMTAHAAKGLEFNHVFIIRANSGSFPSSYKETLVEFPRELRDKDSIAESDDKSLHDQEERRLFYVAMTRARDSLSMYARQGKGKDPTPPGFLRDLLKDSTLGRWLRKRDARGFQTDMFAAAEPSAFVSPVGQWLSMPPAFDLNNRLSATAVETYETCPLQFKLEREWRLPREVPAAIHYGAAMHLVLRAYYDSVRAGRTLLDDDVIALFRTNFGAASVQDRYQYDLYEVQGAERLREFLAACRRGPVPQVIHTEEPFEIKIGDTTVAGRIDRIDRAENGEVIITDYKTGKPRTQKDADESLQLSIYALAAREKWGYRADHLVLYNLEGNAAVISRRDDMELQEAKAKVGDVADKIAAGKFDAKTGFHCSFCAYRNICPATEKRLYTAPGAKSVSTRN